MIEIVPYQIIHQEGIDRMMQEIASEYNLPVLQNSHPLKLPDKYWVALLHKEVIGTVAVNEEEQYAVLKRMFVRKPFRGKEKGISETLLQLAINWCKEKGIHLFYLGTMRQFTAAQRFYEKHGFGNISENELPDNFQNNPLDSVFYQLNLNLKTKL